MASPPSVGRFFAEDYRDAPAWFKSKFLSTLNLFAFPTFTALNSGITAENLNVQFYSTTFVGSATATSNAFSFQSAIQGTPVAVTLAQIQVVGAATPTYISSAVSVANWSYTGSTITIHSIPGLSNSVHYKLTLRVE
jgi:hypothetical protein